jgi:ATP-dependent DNA ligase
VLVSAVMGMSADEAPQRCSRAAAIFRHACWMDLGGIVSKRIGSRYVSGRTRAWLKTKTPNFERR